MSFVPVLAMVEVSKYVFFTCKKYIFPVFLSCKKCLCALFLWENRILATLYAAGPLARGMLNRSFL